MKTILRITFLFLGLPALLLANGIRVDIDNYQVGRTDMYTKRWYNWVFTDGTSDSYTVKGIKATVRNVNGTGLKSSWFKGLEYYGATLTMDGVIVDGSPSGGAMELVLANLSAGKHSITTWHSFYDNVTASTMKVAVNGTTVKTGLKVPTRVHNDDLAARVYLEFTVTAGQSVTIRFTAEGNGTFDNVVLNGFEIDGNDPLKKISNPLPTEGDTHWEQTNGLSWKAASGAVSHDVYLGTDSSTVLNSTSSSSAFKGNKTTTTYALSGLSTFQAAYWWRIDEHFSDGTVVKGDVIPFRVARLAFPTAEGYGRWSRGGRGGRVVFVTNLNDAGTGSLRDAIEVQKGPRTVIFRVGGTILLNGPLVVPADGGDLYVAGQTAPGDGICVARSRFGALSTNDVIIRYVRTRVGDYEGVAMDGMGFSNSNYCIFDHCSISWSIDEGHSSRNSYNNTFQHNIISECLNNSVHYNDATRNGTQPHSFAASISGNKGSYHHNLLCNCTGRNWSLAGGLEQDALHYGGHIDITNNVVYNWRDRTTDGGVRELNFVNNYYKGGAATTMYDHVMEIDGDQLGTGDMQMAYMAGNKMVNYAGSVLLSPTGDQWAYGKSDFSTIAQVKSITPFFPSYVKTETADQAYASVLANVGANFPKQDAIDLRAINNTKNNTYSYVGSVDKLKGIIDSQDDVGGYPSLKGGTAPTDTDNDGMPDSWEKMNGANYTVADNNGDANNDGYTNLENYLGCLVGEFSNCNTIVTDVEEEVKTSTNEAVCYPNPFHESFSLKMEGAFHYSVYGLTGVELERGSGEGIATLGAGLSSGLYVVKVEGSQGTQFVKVNKR
jgi:hypothetical protein